MYSDTNKSGSASDKSFNLMRHQAERDYRQMPVIPSEKYASILNKVGGANNNSSLRMFLEELKSDDNRPPSAYQGNGASFSRAAIHFSPS